MLAAIAAAEIVTLTVTEKAYVEDAPIMELLREALASHPPMTVLSLDNLPRNGEVLERLGRWRRTPLPVLDGRPGRARADGGRPRLVRLRSSPSRSGSG